MPCGAVFVLSLVSIAALGLDILQASRFLTSALLFCLPQLCFFNGWRFKITYWKICGLPLGRRENFLLYSLHRSKEFPSLPKGFGLYFAGGSVLWSPRIPSVAFVRWWNRFGIFFSPHRALGCWLQQEVEAGVLCLSFAQSVYSSGRTLQRCIDHAFHSGTCRLFVPDGQWGHLWSVSDKPGCWTTDVYESQSSDRAGSVVHHCLSSFWWRIECRSDWIPDQPCAISENSLPSGVLFSDHFRRKSLSRAADRGRNNQPMFPSVQSDGQMRSEAWTVHGLLYALQRRRRSQRRERVNLRHKIQTHRAIRRMVPDGFQGGNQLPAPFGCPRRGSGQFAPGALHA